MSFKTLFLPKQIAYDGTQLRSLYAYLEHGVLGDSAVAFIGPCSVSFDHMVDGEDLREQAKIEGSQMVHFIIEMFDRQLIAGVFLQRLFAAIVREVLIDLHPEAHQLRRSGDDLYFKENKLSISIATRSTGSCLIHFAVNVSTQGTPVPTWSLSDWGLDPMNFATQCLDRLKLEIETSVEATQKVRSVD